MAIYEDESAVKEHRSICITDSSYMVRDARHNQLSLVHGLYEFLPNEDFDDVQSVHILRLHFNQDDQ